ncbi:hypothetical protein BDA99DRAFT_572825 [Phascolomyces articulosus]|uniref:Myb-like domain-containing protein n=1 Tax=Phascolomyces articulosus TaxID=60185 RepID=A0AAD5JXT8_9FUNG|nr:hypothetical protein BDA99DRAFT_572825 [Phascolomyces articulosus]
MPGVMDIQHLLCQPSSTDDTYLSPPKPQEPIMNHRMSMYNSSESYYDDYNYHHRYHHHHHHHDNNSTSSCRSCRSDSVSSTNSMPPSPPLLVRSRTTSDASSQASASPREWAYPATPRDEENAMIRLGYEPYYLVPQQQQQSPSSTYHYNHIQKLNSSPYPIHNNNYHPYTTSPGNSGGGGGRYRAPSHGSTLSSRRSRSTSASSTLNAPVQTRMAWTPTEDDLLQQGYDEGLSWAMISATYLPHRSRGCCWGRFKTLQSKNLVDPKRQDARLFRRPWKAVEGASKRQQSSFH